MALHFTFRAMPLRWPQSISGASAYVQQHGGVLVEGGWVGVGVGVGCLLRGGGMERGVCVCAHKLRSIVSWDGVSQDSNRHNRYPYPYLWFCVP